MCIRDRYQRRVHGIIKEAHIFSKQKKMFLLFETPAGYALFEVGDQKKLKKLEKLSPDTIKPDALDQLLSLKAFYKFKDTKEALLATQKMIAGKLPKTLEKFLNKNIISQEIQENIAVADKKIGKAITEKLGLPISHSKQLDEVFRIIRYFQNTLISGLSEDELKSMTLGLAHGLSRYKVSFSSEKVDTMIIQAISLIDDLDRETNNYMMRLREWYGWHFPELGKIVTDSLTYSKIVKAVGFRQHTSKTDLSEILPEDIETEVKQAAEMSMGSDISDTDKLLIENLADQILELTAYKDSLNEYLKNRMAAIAPNLTTMVGELVAARLISHAGSIVNLAKFPASTIQIFGAEKALFKAMKTKKNTPKYGLIYSASIVGGASTKIKGKVARSLAAKCSVCIRVDALGESAESEIGNECRQYIESRVRFLENSVNGESGAFKSSKPQARPCLLYTSPSPRDS
eukprot:TRINITY_DN2776_c0_g1_i3.p1 TRINITY_DN2776_c0_g1~~TRINITY_DN2776_c0_g1_i3.p1  ORF type:complete len:468 (-),score=112.35 TRINITY_DN2776_c0_g1_i3:75-1451(-)